jgi:hypothetical protein
MQKSTDFIIKQVIKSVKKMLKGTKTQNRCENFSQRFWHKIKIRNIVKDFGE